MRFLSALGVCFVSQFVLLAGTAHAQVVMQDLTTLGTAPDPLSDHFQSDTDNRYAAQGIMLGPIVVSGSADEAVGYTNNADRLAGGQGSSAFQTNANLEAHLMGSSRGVWAGSTVSSFYYPSVERQNQTSWTAHLRGYEELGAHYLAYRYEHQRLNQMSTDLGVLAVGRPIPYNTDSFDLSDRIRLHGRLAVTGGVHVDRFVFADVPGLDSSLQQTYRNRFLIDETLGLRYSLTQDSTLMAVIQGTQVRYTTSRYGLPTRNSNGFMALVGYDYAFPGPFQVRVLGGYQRRNYASDAYQPFGTFYAELRGVWSPTHLTQLSLGVSRGIADSAFENVIGFVYTVASLRVRHVYSRNLVLQAEAGIQAGGAGRTPAIFKNTPLYQQNESQKNYVFNVSAERRINHHLSVSLLNSFQNANAAGTRRYSIDSVTVDLKYSL